MKRTVLYLFVLLLVSCGQQPQKRSESVNEEQPQTLSESKNEQQEASVENHAEDYFGRMGEVWRIA